LSSGDVVLNVAKSAEAERLEKERRDVVLVLVDARDVKSYVALFCALIKNRPNRKLVVAAHEDAAPVSPASDAFTETLRFENHLHTSEDIAVPLFRDDRFRAFIGDMRVSANVSKLVELASRAFYGVDAVVDATTHRPHLDWEPIDMSSSTSVTYDRHFDVCVRASFFFVRDLLPHLLKSSGARRVVSVTPPPRCDVFDEEERGVVALARLMRGAHVRGIAAELADANPPVSLVGVWSDALASKADGSFVKGGDEVAQRKDVFGKDAVARAAAKLVDADAKSVSSGSFWRAEDIVAPLPLKNDVFPEKIEETVVAPSSEPTYEDARFEFPDVAELLAEELARLTPPDAEDEDWQLV
jgi:NAD(P)-dependent dehydrogenase (short-subunit alcohol dehydrogenase family)